MPSKPRSKILSDNCTTHKVWRAHNRDYLLTDEVKEKYLRLLGETQHHIFVQEQKLNAICVMTNHSHELFTISSSANFSYSMRIHHSRFGLYYNKKHKRTGKVAESRPHTTCFETHAHSKDAVFYIHANPIRAKMKDDRAYKWSTHKYFAYGKKPTFLGNIKFEFPEWYMRYGRTMKERQRKYRIEFQDYLRRSKKNYRRYSKEIFVGSSEYEKKNQFIICEYMKMLREKAKSKIENLKLRFIGNNTS